MNLPSVPLVVLDTETTGFVPKVHRVIEYAHMVVRGGDITDEYEQLISIPTEIPDYVQVITRIKPDDIAGKPPMEDLRTEIEERIGKDTIIVGQNIGFDIRMLKGEGIDLSDRPWLDTSMLASLLFPEFASYSLGFMSTVLQLNHAPVHRALGDVRATLELLEKCYERVLELPAAERDQLAAAMNKSSPGYKQFFAELPAATATEKPAWFHLPSPPPPSQEGTAFIAKKPELGQVDLLEEPLESAFLERLVKGCASDTKTVHWIAVKNIPATLRRVALPAGVRVLQPPRHLLDATAAKELIAQDSYTADEATLALKLQWYDATTDTELPVHGDEKSIWKGRMACTDKSEEYLKQFHDLPAVMLLDHWQLLQIVSNPMHPGHTALNEEAHIIIDDASMLEDTATKALGWYVGVQALQAAAEGDDQLTKVTTLLQIWLEKLRSDQDVRYITAGDLSTPESSALRDHIDTLLQQDGHSSQVEWLLTALQHCIEPEAAKRITTVETRMDGNQTLSSVPERVSELLSEQLFTPYRVSLLIPPNSADTLPEVLDSSVRTNLLPRPHQRGVVIGAPERRTVREVLSDPPDGKTIILVNSRKLIEQYFVQCTEDLEAAGATLFCQNFSGGQGRTQAEFTAADSPALWVMTPWQFEGVELPANTVSNLFIEQLPFDHPSHPVISRRAEHFQNAFMEYSLPRLEHRLFRLLRTFRRMSTPEGEVELLDNRLREKRYGKEIVAYLNSCCANLTGNPTDQLAPENWQMNLF